MTLCEPDLCSACGACENACPKHCITIKENKKKILLPEIGEGCIECGKCRNVCPVLNPVIPSNAKSICNLF